MNNTAAIIVAGVIHRGSPGVAHAPLAAMVPEKEEETQTMSWYRCQRRADGTWLYFEADSLSEAGEIAKRILGVRGPLVKSHYELQPTLSPHRPLRAGLTVMHGAREIMPVIEGRL